MANWIRAGITIKTIINTDNITAWVLLSLVLMLII